MSGHCPDDQNKRPGVHRSEEERHPNRETEDGSVISIALVMFIVLLACAGLPPSLASSHEDRAPIGSETPEPLRLPVDSSCSVIAASLHRQAEDTLATTQNLLRIAPARAGDNVVHAVVEIPAGTADKWEVTKDGRSLAIEQSGGKLRRIDYLPYPANYGFIPRTLSDLTAGGDGDALDVVLLGPAAPCGAVVQARVLGALRLIDDGETDDKVIAVRPNAPLGDVDGIDALRDRYPGVLEILQTWFVNYEGPGNHSEGFVGAEKAWSVVSEAAQAYADAVSSPPER